MSASPWSLLLGAFCLIFCTTWNHPASAQSTQGSFQARDADRRIELAVAEQKVLSATNVRGYSEGTRGVIDVRLTSNRENFVLVGLRPGETTLLFFKEDGSEEQIWVRVAEEERALVQENRVEKKENIRLDFYFVQFDRARSYQVGLGYPSSITMGTLGAQFDFLTRSFQSASAIVENQALMRLDMAEAHGYARLMRKAALITENGRSAEFSGGGEVNIPVQGSLTTGIHRIVFGSTISVLPRFDAETRRMIVEISADVADLTDDRGSGAPGRLRSTLRTIVNLEQGQAIALAGLSSENELRSRQGVPFLSRIPVLGALFGSTKMSAQNTDLVIFIVPTVVEQAGARGHQQIIDALAAFHHYRGKRSSHERLLLPFDWESWDAVAQKTEQGAKESTAAAVEPSAEDEGWESLPLAPLEQGETHE